LAETGGATLARAPGQLGKKGRIAKPKRGNPLERLDVHKDAILRFMTEKIVPFSDNAVERPMRMIKARVKVSGCFRDPEYAKGFRRVRGYIVYCRKNGVNPAQALAMVAKGEIPAFIMDRLAKN
jgi:transposase